MALLDAPDREAGGAHGIEHARLVRAGHQTRRSGIAVQRPRAAVLSGVEGEVKGKKHLLLALGYQRPSHCKPKAFRVCQERSATQELQGSTVVVLADRPQATIAVEDFISVHDVLPNSDAACLSLLRSVAGGASLLPPSTLRPAD